MSRDHAERWGAQMLVAPLGRGRVLEHDLLKHRFKLADVMPVSSGHDPRQRDATTVHQPVPLASIFSLSIGFGPTASCASGAFVIAPSILCQRPAIPPKVVVPGKASGPTVLRTACFEYAGVLPVQESLVDGAGAAESLGRKRFPRAPGTQYLDDGFKYPPRSLGLRPAPALRA